MKINKKAFTLIELLVVVLIIGILAAIAVPQYQKAVLKARLHQGVSLVESIYQAQQAYYLTHGEFADDIDKLDITIPTNNSCQKWQTTTVSEYECDYGSFGISDSRKNVRFTTNNISYRKILEDWEIPAREIILEQGKRYCWAKKSELARETCKQMGGILFGGEYPNSWTYYQLD